MKNKLNQKGISLIELLAGIPLMALLFATLMLAMVHFIKIYEETKLFMQLQEDLFQAIEYMRYGYPHETETENEGLIGLLTAKDVNISPNGNYIQITPLITDETQESYYWSRFSVNDDDQLEVRSKYGNSNLIESIIIFPYTVLNDRQDVAPVKKFGNEPQFKLMNPRDIWTIEEVNNSGDPVLLGICLEGRVRFREKEQGQSDSEDIDKNTKTITYETSVFLSNVD